MKLRFSIKNMNFDLYNEKQFYDFTEPFLRSCRLCLQNTGFFSIKTPEISCKMDYCNLSRKKWKNLPQCICRNCKCLIENFYNIKVRFTRNEEYIHKITRQIEKKKLDFQRMKKERETKNGESHTDDLLKSKKDYIDYIESKKSKIMESKDLINLLAEEWATVSEEELLLESYKEDSVKAQAKELQVEEEVQMETRQQMSKSNGAQEETNDLSTIPIINSNKDFIEKVENIEIRFKNLEYYNEETIMNENNENIVYPMEFIENNIYNSFHKKQIKNKNARDNYYIPSTFNINYDLNESIMDYEEEMSEHSDDIMTNKKKSYNRNRGERNLELDEHIGHVSNDIINEDDGLKDTKIIHNAEEIVMDIDENKLTNSIIANTEHFVGINNHNFIEVPSENFVETNADNFVEINNDFVGKHTDNFVETNSNNFIEVNSANFIQKNSDNFVEINNANFVETNDDNFDETNVDNAVETNSNNYVVVNSGNFIQISSENFVEINNDTFVETDDDNFDETNIDIFGDTNDDNFDETNEDNFVETNDDNFDETNDDNFDEMNNDDLVKTNTNEDPNSTNENDCCYSSNTEICDNYSSNETKNENTLSYDDHFNYTIKTSHYINRERSFSNDGHIEETKDKCLQDQSNKNDIIKTPVDNQNTLPACKITNRKLSSEKSINKIKENSMNELYSIKKEIHFGISKFENSHVDSKSNNNIKINLKEQNTLSDSLLKLKEFVEIGKVKSVHEESAIIDNNVNLTLNESILNNCNKERFETDTDIDDNKDSTSSINLNKSFNTHIDINSLPVVYEENNEYRSITPVIINERETIANNIIQNEYDKIEKRNNIIIDDSIKIKNENIMTEHFVNNISSDAMDEFTKSIIKENINYRSNIVDDENTSNDHLQKKLLQTILIENNILDTSNEISRNTKEQLSLNNLINNVQKSNVEELFITEHSELGTKFKKDLVNMGISNEIDGCKLMNNCEKNSLDRKSYELNQKNELNPEILFDFLLNEVDMKSEQCNTDRTVKGIEMRNNYSDDIREKNSLMKNRKRILVQQEDLSKRKKIIQEECSKRKEVLKMNCLVQRDELSKKNDSIHKELLNEIPQIRSSPRITPNKKL